VWVRVDLIYCGHKEAVLVLFGVALSCREFEDDGVVFLEVVLCQKIVVVWFNFGVYRPALDADGELAEGDGVRPFWMAFADLELYCCLAVSQGEEC